MERMEDAAKARQELHGTVIEGRKIEVGKLSLEKNFFLGKPSYR